MGPDIWELMNLPGIPPDQKSKELFRAELWDHLRSHAGLTMEQIFELADKNIQNYANDFIGSDEGKKYWKLTSYQFWDHDRYNENQIKSGVAAILKRIITIELEKTANDQRIHSKKPSSSKTKTPTPKKSMAKKAPSSAVKDVQLSSLWSKGDKKSEMKTPTKPQKRRATVFEQLDQDAKELAGSKGGSTSTTVVAIPPVATSVKSDRDATSPRMVKSSSGDQVRSPQTEKNPPETAKKPTVLSPTVSLTGSPTFGGPLESPHRSLKRKFGGNLDDILSGSTSHYPITPGSDRHVRPRLDQEDNDDDDDLETPARPVEAQAIPHSPPANRKPSPIRISSSGQNSSKLISCRGKLYTPEKLATIPQMLLDYLDECRDESLIEASRTVDNQAHRAELESRAQFLDHVRINIKTRLNDLADGVDQTRVLGSAVSLNFRLGSDVI